MTTEHNRNGIRRASAVRQATVKQAAVKQTAIALALMCGGWLGATAESLSSQTRVPSQTPARPGSDYSVLFEFTQSDKELGGSTADQITVIFSNRSAEGPRAPVPLFGEDILQEFSFSGRNFVNNQLRFTRRARDTSFVNARYIRVVNHGGDGWAGDTISLTVDGKSILRDVGMWPRRGASKSGRGGIEKFNSREWDARSYWEYDQQQQSRGGSIR